MDAKNWRVIPCPCGYDVCNNWLIDPPAAIQGVGFGEEEARAIVEFAANGFPKALSKKQVLYEITKWWDTSPEDLSDADIEQLAANIVALQHGK